MHHIPLAHPRSTLVVAHLVVLLAALGLPRLHLRTDGQALVPSKHPAVLYDREIRKAFGIEDQIVVVIARDGPDGIYQEETLRLIAELTAALKSLEGLPPDNVVSLATEKVDRLKDGRLLGFLDPIPATREEVDRLREDMRAIQLYEGTLVAPSGNAAAIFIGVPGDADRGRLYAKICEVLDAYRDRPETLSVVGAPVAEALLGAHLLDDLGLPERWVGPSVPRSDASESWRAWVGERIGLLPLCLAVMGIVFVVAFRRLGAAVLPLWEVGACLVFVLGCMGWLGVPVYLTIAVMPVILATVGITDEIHLFNRYRDHIHAGRDRTEAVRQTLIELRAPVLATSLTSALGFLGFAFSAQPAVRAFGAFTSLGVLFCLAWSLLVLPAMLLFVPPRFLTAAPRSSPRIGHALVQGIARRPRIAIVVFAVVLVALLPGIFRLKIQDSWVGGFAKGSAFRKATDDFNREFLGSHILLVTLESPDTTLTGRISGSRLGNFHAVLPGDTVEDPQTLIGRWIRIRCPDPPLDCRANALAYAQISRAMYQGDGIRVETEPLYGPMAALVQAGERDSLEFEISDRAMLSPGANRFLCDLTAFLTNRKQDGVGGVLGPCGYLATTSYLFHGRDETKRVVPGHPAQVKQVWAHYAHVRGKERAQEVIDPLQSKTLLWVFLEDANFQSVDRLMKAVKTFGKERLQGTGMQLGFAGDIAVSQTLIDAIVSTQVRSLAFSLVGIFLAIALLLRSLRAGLLGLLPSAAAVYAVFAVMGLLGIPLGVATSMFAAMTLGIGVDAAIHLIDRFRKIRSEGLSLQDAAVTAVARTAPAVLTDAVAIALGFGLLGFSLVPANAHLGFLVALGVLGCVGTALLLLPALLVLAPPSERGASAKKGASPFGEAPQA